MMWVFVLLVLVLVLWKTREGFEVPSVIAGVKQPTIDDPVLVSKITSVMPEGSTLNTYISVLKDYYDTVFLNTKTTPSIQEVQTYLFQQSISSADREALAKIMPGIFKANILIDEQNVQFVPDGTDIQPMMAAEPVKENAVPAGYETSDKDPVMPKSKAMFQRSSLERGDGPNVAPYSWNLAAYQQDTIQSVPGKQSNPYVPKMIGTTEHMSTMAGTVTQTNEIYGPRIPKRSAADMVTKPDENSDKIFPDLYSPVGVGGINRHKKVSESKNSNVEGCPVPGSVGGPGSVDVPGSVRGPGSVDVPGSAVIGSTVPGLNEMTSPEYVPISRMVIPSNVSKMEPVPFLNDFSKFYR